jgi:uncharacterized protein YjbJ (UPF0337 family)
MTSNSQNTNTDQSKNVKWPQIKGDIKKTWGKLGDSDLEGTHGDMKSIGSLIQKSYGDSAESYDVKLSEIFKRFEATKEATPGAAKMDVKK